MNLDFTGARVSIAGQEKIEDNEGNDFVAYCKIVIWGLVGCIQTQSWPEGGMT
ncbi:MAG: hypothetical protein U0V70_19685 [Terriglobia bacterium]